jgi:HEAT repeat protein
MVSLLQQAQIAAQQHNWSALGQILEQWMSRGTVRPSAVNNRDTPDRDIPSFPVASPPEPSPIALDLALQVLRFGDFQARWDVAKLLPGFGEGAIAPLITLLRDDTADLEARWYTARILGNFAHPQAIQALITAVQADDDEDLSQMAAAALANLGPAAISALLPLLALPTLRPLVVPALAQIRNSATIAPLLSVVDDPDASIRAIALEALGSFHDPRVPAVLVQALTDPAATVRRVAIAGLGFRPDLSNTEDWVQRLGDRLGDQDQTVGQQAAIALGRWGTPTAAALLFQALQSPYAPLDLQLDLVRALARTGQATALDYFQTCLCPTAQDADPSPARHPDLYQEIVRLLGDWSTPALKPRAADLLLQTLHSPSGSSLTQQQALALALGQLGQPQALDPLIQLLVTDDLRLRLHVIAALKRLDAPRAYAHLTELAAAAPQTNLQRGVAIALQEW